jgi:hypothetical protein
MKGVWRVLWKFLDWMKLIENRNQGMQIDFVFFRKWIGRFGFGR